MICSQSERSSPSSAEEKLPHRAHVFWSVSDCVSWGHSIFKCHAQCGGPLSAWPCPGRPHQDLGACRATQKTTFEAALFQVRFILNHTSDKEGRPPHFWPWLAAHAESSKKAFAMAWATFSTLFSFASDPASSRASFTQYCSVLGR